VKPPVLSGYVIAELTLTFGLDKRRIILGGRHFGAVACAMMSRVLKMRPLVFDYVGPRGLSDCSRVEAEYAL
jgi:hypothetical protein